MGSPKLPPKACAATLIFERQTPKIKASQCDLWSLPYLTKPNSLAANAASKGA